MARKKSPPPPSLTKEQVTINVYPFGGLPTIRGWIEDGWLDTAAGPPARCIRVEIGPIDRTTQQWDDYYAAIRCLRARKYTNAWEVNHDGTLTRIEL